MFLPKPSGVTRHSRRGFTNPKNNWYPKNAVISADTTLLPRFAAPQPAPKSLRPKIYRPIAIVRLSAVALSTPFTPPARPHPGHLHHGGYAPLSRVIPSQM